MRFNFSFSTKSLRFKQKNLHSYVSIKWTKHIEFKMKMFPFLIVIDVFNMKNNKFWIEWTINFKKFHCYISAVELAGFKARFCANDGISMVHLSPFILFFYLGCSVLLINTIDKKFRNQEFSTDGKSVGLADDGRASGRVCVRVWERERFRGNFVWVFSCSTSIYLKCSIFFSSLSLYNQLTTNVRSTKTTIRHRICCVKVIHVRNSFEKAALNKTER